MVPTSKKLKKKRGPPDHFIGFKFDFLSCHATQFQLAKDSKCTSEFYDRITLQFIAKYGDDLESIRKDPAEDPPDPAEFEELNLTEDEAMKKTEAFLAIRRVSILFPPFHRHRKLTYQSEIIPVV